MLRKLPVIALAVLLMGATVRETIPLFSSKMAQLPATGRPAAALPPGAANPGTVVVVPGAATAAVPGSPENEAEAIILEGEARDGAVHLSWRERPRTAVEGAEVPEIKGYAVLYGVTGKGGLDHRIDVHAEHEATVTGLVNGEKYTFLVVGRDLLGKEVAKSNLLDLTPAKERVRSPVERRFAEAEVATEAERELSQFGYDLFAQGAPGRPPLAAPGPDYRVAPGDVLDLFLWGQVDAEYAVEVEPDGAVRIPKVGVVSLAGLTLKEARERIHAALAHQFSGFHLSVSVKRLHAVQVFVVGEVARPGSYEIPGPATAFAALFAAGGPTKQGSLRRIELRRVDGSVERIDLYAFLMHGDRSGDLRLAAGDTLFVPVVGPTVAVTGQVKRPAIYELAGDETLKEAITFAGGLTAHADPRRIALERVEGRLRRVVEEVTWEEVAAGGHPLKSGDRVVVRAIYPEVEGRVELLGEVKQPGRYPWHPGMHLSELLHARDQLRPRCFLDYAEVRRIDPESLRETVVSFSPAGLLAGRKADDLELLDRDRIQLFSEEELARRDFVEVRGEVAHPGRYPYVPGMRIRDLIYQAGNLTSAAYLEEGELTRLHVEGSKTTTERIYFNVADALAGRGDHDQLLRPNDQLFIRAVPDWSAERVVEVRGEVRFPGTYAFRRGERISEVLERAGGFTPRAFLKGAVFTRESVRELQEERLKAFIQEQEQEFLRQSAEAAKQTLQSGTAAALEKALEDKRQLLERLRATQVKGRMVVRILPLEELRGSPYDLELEEGDTITIPPVPWSVNVLGRVYNPTSLIYEEGHTVGYYLAKTGGVREDADEKHIYLVRADGTVISRAQERGFRWWWSRGEHRWLPGRFDGLLVERGDTILVPEQPITVGGLSLAKDVSQILANIFVAAGNLKFLFQ
ncbi:MAG: hypothetical protein D6739_00475 [Nitrospirae bacterium]|nr:MAG: hypothetical protein D6739_00475 [Nitrospirota bacterium]